MSWAPTTAPHGAFDATVYLVLDSFGARGTTYRETDVEHADLETVITDLPGASPPPDDRQRIAASGPPVRHRL